MRDITLRTATPAEIDAALSKSQHQCPACGVYFKKIRHWQVFCSEPCRKRFHGTAFALERLQKEYQEKINALEDKVRALEEQIKELSLRT